MKMGTGSDESTLPTVGDLVRDKEANDPDGSTAVVTAVHANTLSADRFIPALEKTVAEVNPGYPVDSPVVTVSYLTDLEPIEEWEQRTSEELLEAIKTNNIATYDFPAARLDPASQSGTENRSPDDTPTAREKRSSGVSPISSQTGKKFDLSTVPNNVPMDGSGDEHYIRRRSEYLRRKTGLREPLPQALALREIGYSSSGIAKKLETRKQTVETWMEEIAETYGENALETRPQSEPVPELE